MKNKPKHYLKLGILLFAIPILLASCQKDDFETPTTNTDISKDLPYTFREIGKKEIEGNPKLMEKLHKAIPSKHSSSNKTIYAEEYGFYVNTDR